MKTIKTIDETHATIDRNHQENDEHHLENRSTMKTMKKEKR
jgi:hypothetical protein